MVFLHTNTTCIWTKSLLVLCRLRELGYDEERRPASAYNTLILGHLVFPPFDHRWGLARPEVPWSCKLCKERWTNGDGATLTKVRMRLIEQSDEKILEREQASASVHWLDLGLQVWFAGHVLINMFAFAGQRCDKCQVESLKHFTAANGMILDWRTHHTAVAEWLVQAIGGLCPFFCFFAGCHKTTCWRSGQNANRNRTVKQRREVWWVRCQAYMDLSDAEKISVRLAGRKSTGKHQEIRWNASQHFMFAQTFSQAMWLTPGCFSWIPWEQLLSTMVQRVLYTLYTVRSKTPWATYERIVDRNGFNMSTGPFPTNSLYYLGRVPKCPVRGSLQVSLLLAKLLLSCTDLHHKPYRAYTWNAAQLPQAEVHRRFLERVDSWNLWCLCLRICEHEKTRPKPNRTLYTWLRSMTQCSCTMFIDIQWHADTEW